MAYGRKDNLDRFYTRREVAERCVASLDLERYDLIVEPSAGDGAFVDALYAQPHKLICAFDVSPGRDDIKTKDFFTFMTEVDPDRVLIVGNPPFGKQNNLALKFIDYAAKWANTIAFILPRSFLKPSVQNKVNKILHLQYVLELDDDSFLHNGKPYSVPAVFQVWKKGDSPRPKLTPVQPVGFEYVLANKANLCIRRVGFYAGRATVDMTKNQESHFFVNIHDGAKVPHVMRALNSYPWTYGNTVGPRTVTKFDINPIVNECLGSSSGAELYRTDGVDGGTGTSSTGADVGPTGGTGDDVL